MDDSLLHEAKQALEDGFSHIACLLNDIATKRKLFPKIVVHDATKKYSRNDFENAKAVFRSCLPAIRTFKLISADDASIAPWTLGYINGRENLPWLVSVVADYDEAVSKPLDFLASRDESYWKIGRWKTHIVDPVIQKNVDWKKWFDEPIEKGLLPRPSGSIPKKPAEHAEWKAWENAICGFVSARSSGVGVCWDQHKKMLQDVAGVDGKTEFKGIHHRYRNR